METINLTTKEMYTELRLRLKGIREWDIPTSILMEGLRKTNGMMYQKFIVEEYMPEREKRDDNDYRGA